MKARIKKTGEIVNLAPYATITLDKCDSWGNPIELPPKEVELISDDIEQPTNFVANDDYWQKVRERASMLAMQSIIPTQKGEYMMCDVDKKFNDCAIEAIEYADALIKRLKSK